MRLLFAKDPRHVRAEGLPLDDWNDLQGHYVKANHLAPLFGEASSKLKLVDFARPYRSKN